MYKLNKLLFFIFILLLVTSCSTNNNENDTAIEPPFEPQHIVSMIQEQQLSTLNEHFTQWKLPEMDVHPEREEVKLVKLSDQLQLVELFSKRSVQSRFLFFRKLSTDWTLLDYLDVSGRHGHEPTYHIEQLNHGETTWFILNQLGGYGTGTVTRRETWYKIGSNHLEPKLEYVTHEHEWMSPSQTVFSNINAQINIEFDTSEPESQEKSSFAVEIEYNIEITDSDLSAYATESEAKLFDTTRTLRYVWNPKKDAFELDQARSDGDDSLLLFTPDNLKKYYDAELVELSSKANPAQKAWLDKIKYEY